MGVQTKHFLKPHPPPKKAHINFLSAKNPHENNKNQAKMLKVYGPIHPPQPIESVWFVHS